MGKRKKPAAKAPAAGSTQASQGPVSAPVAASTASASAQQEQAQPPRGRAGAPAPRDERVRAEAPPAEEPGDSSSVVGNGDGAPTAAHKSRRKSKPRRRKGATRALHLFRQRKKTHAGMVLAMSRTFDPLRLPTWPQDLPTALTAAARRWAGRRSSGNAPSSTSPSARCWPSWPWDSCSRCARHHVAYAQRARSVLVGTRLAPACHAVPRTLSCRACTTPT